MFAIVASYNVAPHAGAWIETLTAYVWRALKDVAPHAGAWIETSEISCKA